MNQRLRADTISYAAIALRVFGGGFLGVRSDNSQPARAARNEIVASYPQMSLADVHAALAYYFDHKEAIDQQMKESNEFVEQFKAVHGPGPLARKLSGMDAGSDLISS